MPLGAGVRLLAHPGDLVPVGGPGDAPFRDDQEGAMRTGPNPSSPRERRGAFALQLQPG